MSAIQRKSATKKQEQSDSEVQEIEIPLPQPKKKGSSKQEPVQVVVDDDSTPSETKPSKKENGSSKQKDATPEVVDDDSTPSVAVAETKPSKKEKSSSKQKDAIPEVIDDSTPSVAVAETKPSKKSKKSAPKSDEEVESNEVEPAPKKGKGKKVESEDEGECEGEVVEKSKKQPPKSLGEQIADSVKTLAIQSEKFKVLIDLKEVLHKDLTTLISSRKKELKKQKDDESEDANLQFLEKQKDSLKDEIAILKSSIRELASVSKVIEKATKQLDSKKKDPSKPKKTRAPIFVAVSTVPMNQFIQQNLTLKTNDGNQIFEQTPQTNSDGRFLVERTQLMQLIHAYIREKSLRKDGFIELDAQLKPLFHTYLEGDFSRKVDSKSVICILSHHLEKKA